MLNPVNRTGSREGVQHSRVKPYIISGDVYDDGTEHQVVVILG
jgi:cellobiose phosphorylase